MTELTETKLEIKQNGQHNNMTVKTRYKWDKAKKQFVLENGKKVVVEQGLPINTYVVVEKLQAAGYENKGEFGSSFSCKVKYQDKDCSFWLKDTKTQPDHANYAKCGGIGDKVKISCTKETVVVRGEEKLAEVLHFEKVA